MSLNLNILKYIIFSGTIFIHFVSKAQELDKTALKNKLKADSIVLDAYSHDGFLIARHAKTQKWGMYQQAVGNKTYETIPMLYDSLGFFNHGFFKHRLDYTLAKKDGKYWIINDYGNNSQTFNYDKLTIIKSNHQDRAMLAAKANGKWGYINENSGDTLFPFAFKNKKDLPQPDPIYYKNPKKTFSEAYSSIFNRPDTITSLDLSFQKLNELPDAIKQCSQLKYLNLEGNYFEKFPDILKALPNLETLYLGGNHRLFKYDNKNSLTRLKELKNLKSLSLGDIIKGKNNRHKTYYTAHIEFPQNFEFPPNLESLYLGEIDLNSNGKSVIELIYSYPNLKHLYLSGDLYNPLQIDFSQIATGNKLETLECYKISSVESLNNNLNRFPNLKYLSLVFSDPDSDDFGQIVKLKKLEYLYIRNIFDGKVVNGFLRNKGTVADFSSLQYKYGNQKVSLKDLQEVVEDFKTSVLNKD